MKTYEFLQRLENGHFQLDRFFKYSTHWYLAWARIVQVCCGTDKPLPKPDEEGEIRFPYCQKCGDPSERPHGMLHIHHIYGEEDFRYKRDHTRSMILKCYRVLCPRCHACYHGDSDILKYQGNQKGRANTDLRERMNRYRIWKSQQPKIETIDGVEQEIF